MLVIQINYGFTSCQHLVKCLQPNWNIKENLSHDNGFVLNECQRVISREEKKYDLNVRMMRIRELKGQKRGLVKQFSALE